MSDLCCFMLCPPDVQEKLLDALLMVFPNDVFTSTPTFSHGGAHGAMSATEQVLGRTRGWLVQILLKRDEWNILKIQLLRDFAGTGLRYWLTPVVEEGVCV